MKLINLKRGQVSLTFQESYVMGQSLSLNFSVNIDLLVQFQNWHTSIIGYSAQIEVS